MSADDRAYGILLRVKRYQETSLLCHWLTQGEGRFTTLAKGALRPKSPLRGKLDLYYEGDFSFARSRRSQVHLLKEVMVVDSHPHFRHELPLLQLAAYATQLLERLTETETELGEIFGLFQTLLREARPGIAVDEWALALELKILSLLGQRPPIETWPIPVSESARLLLKARFVSLQAPTRLLTPMESWRLALTLEKFLRDEAQQVLSFRKAVMLSGGNVKSAE